MGQRGRRKGANGEQSRALLLTIAAEEFANHGYYETKISTIVKRAGLTQPTFYLYFQNKEAIFQELVNLFRNNLFEFIKKSQLDPGMDAKSLSVNITAGLANIFTFFACNPHLTRIGFFVANEAEEIKEQLATLIEENLTFEVQEGYFRKDIDMNMVAESLIGIIERLTFTKLLQGLKKPESLAMEIVQLLLHGMICVKDG